jgi:organic radical activating enzyme
MLSKEIQLEVNKGAMLPLMEEFYTIQGEFSRNCCLFCKGGCDVGCHWCDVKKVGMQNCILRQASIRLYPMQKNIQKQLW